MQIICAYGPKSRQPDAEKFVFMMKWGVNGTREIQVKSSFLWVFQLTGGEMCRRF